jgi:hypothetical protein
MKKRSKLHKFIPYLMGLSLLTMVAACGSDSDDDSSSGGSTPPPQEEQQPDEGTYQVVLTPLNPSVAGPVSGIGTITVAGDEVDAVMNLTGVPANVTHLQFVYSGTTCPTAGSDVGNPPDGFVDVIEAVTVAGNQLIPLDGELASQLLGITQFPVASGS